MEFAKAMRNAGLEPPVGIEPGRVLRFPGIGKGASNKAAWCRLFDDMRGGVFGDFSSGLSEVWQSRSIETYSPAERADFMRQVDASRKQHAHERAKRAADAAKRAVAIINQCKHEQHAYLDSHGMGDALGLVYYPTPDVNLLVVPMMAGRELAGVQLLDRFGAKKFLKGQRCSMAEHIIGGTRGTDFLVEGYCTALALSKTLQAMHVPARIHTCFSASNMTKIGLTLKRAIIICDHDKSGVGRAAGAATGHPYYVPEVEGDDWCDVWQREGTLKAGQILRPFLQSAKNWLTSVKA